MDSSELLDTIIHVLEEAEQGIIDPWDVKVIEVIDRYLELMAPKEKITGYESDLSQSGQAFLSASILVLFKANTLMHLSSAEILDQEAIDDTFFDNDNLLSPLSPTPRLQLEQYLRRRPSAMPPLKRPITQHELIQQLQIMAEHIKGAQTVNKPVRPKRQGSVQNIRRALELAHQENLTEVVGELEGVLNLWAKEALTQEKCLTLEELVNLWTQSRSVNNQGEDHDSENSQLVSVFWALLLLSAKSKVELSQDEFYQEIKIRWLTNSVELQGAG